MSGSRRRRNAVRMSELERDRDETACFIGEAVDALSVIDDREARAGGDDVVRRETVRVRYRRPDHILPRPKRQLGKSAFDTAVARHTVHWARRHLRTIRR